MLIYNPRKHRVLIVNKRVLKVHSKIYHKDDVILLTRIRGQVASLIQRRCLSLLKGERLRNYLEEHPDFMESVSEGMILSSAIASDEVTGDKEKPEELDASSDADLANELKGKDAEDDNKETANLDIETKLKVKSKSKTKVKTAKTKNQGLNALFPDKK